MADQTSAPRTPPNLFPITVKNNIYNYGDRLFAGKGITPDGGHVLPGSVPYVLTDPIRMCCQEKGCTMCGTEPPCKGPVDPKLAVEQIKLIHNVEVGYVSETDMDEMHFDHSALQRIPILNSAGMAAQLRRWHDAVFGANRLVVYHVYRIAPLPAGGLPMLNLLGGHHIAIPVAPDEMRSGLFAKP